VSSFKSNFHNGLTLIIFLTVLNIEAAVKEGKFQDVVK